MHTKEVVAMTVELREDTARAVVEPVSRRQKLVEVANAVSQTANVNLKKAVRYINWVEDIVGIMRVCEYDTHYLTQDELLRYHDIMEAVMPDEMAPVPGSAHDLLERYVLDPSREEFGLRHSRSPDVAGTPEYCTVDLQLHII